jgi:hypothetical protein
MKHVKVISDTIKQLYWMLVLQGLVFITLGFLVALYPPALFVLASIAFLLIGLILLTFGWRVYRFWTKLPGFLKK